MYAERFFTRLIMKADDYGCFHANVSLLKANLFPFLLNEVREADISRWMAECQKAGLIVLYEIKGKRYLQIIEFRQRLDKAKAKFPLPPSDLSIPVSTDSLELDNEFPAETETESETESETEKKDTPDGACEAGASPPNVRAFYEQLKKNKDSVWSFVKANNPDFIEPYKDLWNFFAKEKGLSQVTKITKLRTQKFRVRFKEKGFDFLAVIKKATESEFLITSGKWFCFDWIFENESNYLKVIEGNYDKKPPQEVKQNSQPKTDKPAQQTFGQIIGYLFDRYKEGGLDERLILPEYYDTLVIRGAIPAGDADKQSGSTFEDKKRQAVIELFKRKNNAQVDGETSAAAGQR